VFTRKAMTDLCYLDCVRKLLAARPRLYPQFATHNALTVACVIEDAAGTGGFEFQRLHGMGEALYESLLAELPGLTCRVYAPVGGYADLLAYLVRRLLENGANSSFVSVAADPAVPIESILRRPQSWIADASHARHSHIPLPRDLFGPTRRNSAGLEFRGRSPARRNPCSAPERTRDATDRWRSRCRAGTCADITDRWPIGRRGARGR
jgi:RHH-type proline utilization regulon transcriptional repressor/proline dehydrogenase/delta 1-pyrroline-5-carboxylate dehydrogenase